MKDIIEELVSIIVPVYNAEKYLDKCIESILKQSYTNYELLLVDDGSTDMSAGICDSYALKDERIKVFHQNNAGVSSARNKGIQEACGEYITFIDSDDSIQVVHIEGLITGIKKYHCDLAMGDVCFVKGNRVWNNGWIKTEQLISTQEYILRVKDDFPNVAIGSTCNKIFMYKTIVQKELCFRKDINYSEDYMFNLEYLKHCNSIALIPQSSLCYRLSEEDSLSKKKLSLMDSIKLSEDIYFAFCDENSGLFMGGSGYLRILTDCIAEEIKRGGKAANIAGHLKVYLKNNECWNYVKKAKLCKNYPYVISGILLKWKCYWTVGKLFEMANFLKGKKS